MKDQLVDRYLQGPDCRHGIYLIVWFNKKKWDDQDSRKRQVPNWTISEAKTFFKKQAEKFSISEIVVRSFVLDANCP